VADCGRGVPNQAIHPALAGACFPGHRRSFRYPRLSYVDHHERNTDWIRTKGFEALQKDAYELLKRIMSNHIYDAVKTRKELTVLENEMIANGFYDILKHLIDSGSGDIFKKSEMNYSSPDILQKAEYDCVLSFNYTNTFQLLYENHDTKYCFIHGKAQTKAENTDMILGIEETLEENEEDMNLLFAKFKKYFQRIFYKTGSEYKDWIKVIQRPQENTKHEIYIVGHSLGKTDHEVLNEFFSVSSDVRITIFYHDEESKINVIKRTVEMIGKDELIRRVHGTDWSIRFVDQYDEKDGILRRLNEDECILGNAKHTPLVSF